MDEAEADAENVARQIALRRLTQRDQSRAELASALAKKNVPHEIAERLLDRFEEVGLIDDERFARAWAESRHRTRHLSKRNLAAELQRKGIEQEAIDLAVAEIDQEAELAAARQVAQKKMRSLHGQPREVAWRRLTAALARRGYGPSVVISVAQEVLKEPEIG